MQFIIDAFSDTDKRLFFFLYLSTNMPLLSANCISCAFRIFKYFVIISSV